VPGLELDLFFRRVRDRVYQASNGRQEPYNFGSLGAEPVYLNPLPPNRPPVAGPAAPVTVRDDAAPTPLGIPAPTDPDGDPLVIQVTGLPQGGTASVGNRALLIGDYLTAEQLKAASFHPDGGHIGEAGSLAYEVSDGRGGQARSGVAVTVVPSNNPPVVASETVFRAVANRFALPQASDQDGDALTVRIQTVPEHGKLRRGKMPIEPGNRLNAADVGELTYDPEDASPGTTGRLAFTVEDGRGGKTEGAVVVEIVGPGETAEVRLDEALWRRLGLSASEAELRGFLALFPQSPFAAEARARLGSVPVAAAEPPSTPAAAVATATPPLRKTAVAARNADQRRAATAAASPEPLAQPQPVQLAVATPQATRRLSASRSTSGPGFQDCTGCPVVIPVSAGRFTMGRNDGGHSERPAHEVVVAKPFGLSRYEITVGQWKTCVAEGGCPNLPSMKGYTDATPVYNVTHDDAVAYTAWLARTTGERYRLPSEAEWEYAARAGTTTPYWWGERVDGKHVLCRKCGSTVEPTTPPPVESQPPNPWGLVGMSGGVREWLADCWLKVYDKGPSDTRPRVMKNCQQRVTRGGSWLDEPTELTVSSRNFYDADVPYLANGFRVARDLE
jgi:formylglycine-generating enzyme required for sulfatase activity